MQQLGAWVATAYDALVKRAWGLLLAGAFALAALTTLGELNALLKGMHVPGGGAYRLGALADVGFHAPHPSHARDVLATWEKHRTSLQAAPVGRQFPSYSWVAKWFLIIDSAVFVPFYGFFLAILLLRIRDGLKATATLAVSRRIALRRVTRRVGAPPTDAPVANERLKIVKQLSVYRSVVTVALWALLALLAFDLLENLFTGLVVASGSKGSSTGSLAAFLWLFSTLKWLTFFALILVPIVVAGLTLLVFRPRRSGRVLETLIAVRLQLLVLVVFAVALFKSDQSIDAIRRWVDNWPDGVAAGVLTALLAAVTFLSARRLVDQLPKPVKPPQRKRWFALAGVLLVGLGVGSQLAWHAALGLIVIGAILIGIAILSWLTRDLEQEAPIDGADKETLFGRRLIPALVGAAPLVLLGLAVLRASLPEVMYSGNGLFSGIILTGLVLQAAGWGLCLVGLLIPPDLARWVYVSAYAVTGVVFAAIAADVYTNPWRTGEALGTVAVLSAFLMGAIAITSLLILWAEIYGPLGAFAFLRLRRTPVLVVLALWFVIAGIADRSGHHFDVRKLQATAAVQDLENREAITPSAAFAEWKDSLPTKGAVPMVFVAAAGGGIRAAYWTAAVLHCVLEGVGAEACQGETGDKPSVFAASGISGGSLGLASYVAHLRHPSVSGWPEKQLDDDYLAPAVAWWLFADLPTGFIGRQGGMDRAEVLERAWERSWVSKLPDSSARGLFWHDAPSTDGTPFAQGIYDLWASRASGARPPLLFLNGTKVQDGCRFNASVFATAVENRGLPKNADPETLRLVEDCLALRLFERTDKNSIYVPPNKRTAWIFAATEDLLDYACPNDNDSDVRLSTDVLLSARFPYIMPSGRMQNCGKSKRAINLVDGGYFDTSGASPLVELWAKLAEQVESIDVGGGACVVPVFLQIDTGYSDPTSTAGSRPLETTVPLKTFGAGRNAREANARQAAAIDFGTPFPSNRPANIDRYAHVYPRAHPGSKAPLGWTLSKTAMKDLREQLAANAAEIRKVRSWFSPMLTCKSP